jgi:hypothetical protein
MGTQRDALERTITACSLDTDGRHAAVVELARTLADQCDQTGPEGPSTRLSAAYLSVLKDLARTQAMAGARGASRSSTLGRMRAEAGAASAA